MAAKPTRPPGLWSSVLVLALVGGFLFQGGDVRQRPELYKDCWGNESSEPHDAPVEVLNMILKLACWKCRKINVWNVPGNSILLIWLPLATCATPLNTTKNHQFAQASLPASGATCPWPAAMAGAGGFIDPEVLEYFPASVSAILSPKILAKLASHAQCHQISIGKPEAGRQSCLGPSLCLFLAICLLY